MTNSIRHRGPDGGGYWIDEKAGLGMGHRRLSIIDLSESGAQPMVSECGRFVLSYNGEIYNHLEIRESIEARSGQVKWKGHSDTETLLRAIIVFGLEEALSMLNGMFAFAFWDVDERKLSLARDRAGEKPLYYGIQNGALLFGSELKALREHPSWEGSIDRHSLGSFFRFSYVPAPKSIYSGVSKLRPGHLVTFDRPTLDGSEQTSFWNFHKGIDFTQCSTSRLAWSESIEQLTDLLLDSVKIRMASDVPLGAFLSGGIDSSLIVALMQAQSSASVKTYTIGFNERSFNEAEYAKKVAQHLGTNHTELYISDSDALSVIPRLGEVWDEPFADSSQIPTLLVSELARRYVTVSLSGDGGDELFFGYGRYRRAQQLERVRTALPEPLKWLALQGLRNFPVTPFRLLGSLTGCSSVGSAGDRLRKSVDLLGSEDSMTMYRQLMSHCRHPELLLEGLEGGEEAMKWGFLSHPADFRDSIAYTDFMTYLPDDILTKVDRASMSVSLEARVPLLDHRVVEFATKLSMNHKVRDGEAKAPLKQILSDYLPRDLFERPKKGFGLPIDSWLNGPLKDWGESLLDETRLKNEGFLNVKAVREMWQQQQQGKRRWHYHLWDVLMFQVWNENEM